MYLYQHHVSYMRYAVGVGVSCTYVVGVVDSAVDCCISCCSVHLHTYC